jgi:hypothetical protein
MGTEISPRGSKMAGHCPDLGLGVEVRELEL